MSEFVFKDVKTGPSLRRKENMELLQCGSHKQGLKSEFVHSNVNALLDNYDRHDLVRV